MADDMSGQDDLNEPTSELFLFASIGDLQLGCLVVAEAQSLRHFEMSVHEEYEYDEQCRVD